MLYACGPPQEGDDIMRAFLAAFVAAALSPSPLVFAEWTDDCGQLVAFIQQNHHVRFTTTIQQARAMEARKDQRGCKRAFKQAKEEAGFLSIAG
jgi:hypothetical protein